MKVFLTWGRKDFVEITENVLCHLDRSELGHTGENIRIAGGHFREECGATMVWFAKDEDEFFDNLITWRKQAKKCKK